MAKQVDYPADTVGIDGTVYPTVGENIRHLVPLDNLTWVDVTISITKGIKPELVTLKGIFAGLFYVKSSNPSFNFVHYIHTYIETNNANTIIDVQPSCYNYYGGVITLSLLIKNE